ncbi:hypothetical protein EC973_007442 [Apophysomyces ossiformis]|uniref:Uncharacterized protein n=1 Tax=Apophysomyces ossiformis TaxID=679940 RepID=A0A8H7BD47_9FUNG|nr:hypothetical protein EC973_007442 [Apophysomyces ossiformis]
MAIKNMDKIYQRAEEIIAVPDLCYNEGDPRIANVTSEEIVTAIDMLNESERRASESYYIPPKERKHILSLRGTIYIIFMLEMWACRSWVISERLIGANLCKLEIITLKANEIIPCLPWRQYIKIDWYITFNQSVMLKTIINSKATKYEDRLFAILPHTKYKAAKQKLLNKGQRIETMIDLKMALLDILDNRDKIILLQYEDYLRIKSTQVRPGQPSFLHDQTIPPNLEMAWYQGSVFCSIETMKIYGKHALKVSGRYSVDPTKKATARTAELLRDKVDSVVKIFMVHKGAGSNSCLCLRCAGSKGVWVVDSMQLSGRGGCEGFPYGEFIIF